MASKKQQDQTWGNTSKVRGENPDVYRRDAKGDVIYRSSYGQQSNMGWEVDHSNPKSKGGTDNPRNLQAMQWENNRRKSDKR